MSLERPRRVVIPTEKQKQILADQAIAAAPKQPKTSRNAPAEVQKRRQAGEGSISSRSIELVKRSVRPPHVGSGLRLVKYTTQRSEHSGTTPSLSHPSSRTASHHSARDVSTQQSGPHGQSKADSTSKQQIDLPQAGKENRPVQTKPGLGSPIRLQRRTSPPSPSDLFATDADVINARRPSQRRRTPSPSRHRTPSPSLPPPSSSPVAGSPQAFDSATISAVYYNEEDGEFYEESGRIVDYDALELAEQEDDPEADLDPEAQPNMANDSSGIDMEQDRTPIEGEPDLEVVSTRVGKRPRASSNAAEESLTKAKMKKVTKSDGRIRCKDFDGHEQDFIKFASNEYRACLASECLFPDSVTEGRFVKRSWEAACKEMDEELLITSQVTKILTRLGSHFRSVAKLEVRPVVMNCYGFKAASQSNKTKIFNSTRATKLKSDQCFARPLPQLDIPSEKRTGLYHNKAIGQFLTNALFKRKDSIGVTHASYFGTSMPKPTIAFALTMLEFGISEWSSGCFADTKFHETDWKKTYFDHLADLTAFETAMQRFNALNKIAVKLLNDSRAHAGVGPLQSGEKRGRVSERSLQTELAAYEAGAVFVSDEEEGNEGAPQASTSTTAAAAT
ncbi:hypothetical protein EIP86_007417 [Pleurotus ostreatoroseus]|nr:hypothetical protein EIP86_007417 [Pleurotus ostreatoroseus]